MNFARPFFGRTSMNPPPPMFPAAGSTTASANPTATAASTAFPPFFKISTPASDASASSLTTIACSPRTAADGQFGCAGPSGEVYSCGCVCCFCLLDWDCARIALVEKQKITAKNIALRIGSRIYSFVPHASTPRKTRCSMSMMPSSECSPSGHELSREISSAILSGEAHACSPAGFKHREQMADSHQIPDDLVVIHHKKFAAGFSRGYVEANQRADARAVHPVHFLEVHHDPLRLRDQALPARLQNVGVLERQPAGAIDNRLVALRLRMELQPAVCGLVRLLGHCYPPLIC